MNNSNAVESIEIAATETKPTAEVVDIKVNRKADTAQVIYAEEAVIGDEKLRARVIARFKSELSMSDAGASTYFQNCKKRANGEKVKHYYKPASVRNAAKSTEPAEAGQELPGEEGKPSGE